MRRVLRRERRADRFPADPETRHAEHAPLSNWQTRDVESVLHPYTPIHKLKQTGTMVIERGKGVLCL